MKVFASISIMTINRNRCYNPGWGASSPKILSGSEGGMNLYAYANNNPENFNA
jgi:hypothetical protein